MLDLIEPHIPELKDLAETWLSSGASSFAIWVDRKPIQRWSGYPEKGNKQSISAPIHLNGRLLAELRVEGLDSPAALQRLNTDARLISSLLPIEMDRKSLASELVDTRDQLAILYELSNIASRALSVEKLFRLLAAEIHKLIRTQEIRFVLQLQDHAPLVVIYPERTLVSGELQILLAQAMANQRASFAVMNTAHEADHMLFVPIHVQKAPFAALILVREAGKEFSSPEIKLARAFADFTAPKVEYLLMVQSNVDLVRLETEVELARKIQDSLLPKSVPIVDTLDIRVVSRPASRVGGDFYDFILHPNTALDIIIGDVSGKGMPAALLMAMTLKVLRTQANTLAEPEPDVIISRSNAELYNDFCESVTFSTLFVSQYDPRNQQFAYANAGHSPVIYYPAGGSARMLTADAIPIGLFPSLHCEKRSLKLKTGDVLVMATDGINETMNPTNRLFGFTRLMMLTEELAPNPAREIMDGILTAVEEFGLGRDQADDQTLIVIKCEAPGSVSETYLENAGT